MFGSVILEKIAAFVAIVLVAFAAGWVVNGWRWDNKALTLAAAQTQARITAEAKSRAQELSIQAAADVARNIKDAEITVVRTQLDTALMQLRQRPARGSVLPSATGTRAPATGRELSREDGEFLARESASTNKLKALLLECHATYNAVRNGLR